MSDALRANARRLGEVLAAHGGGDFILLPPDPIADGRAQLPYGVRAEEATAEQRAKALGWVRGGMVEMQQ